MLHRIGAAGPHERWSGRDTGSEDRQWTRSTSRRATPPHGRFVGCPPRRQPDQRDDQAKAVASYDKAFAFHDDVTRRTDHARAHRASPQRAPVSGQSLRMERGARPAGTLAGATPLAPHTPCIGPVEAASPCR
jgi:hypothetical protein